MNAPDRGRLIWRISELIEENADELAMLESLDNGKPYSVARAADVPLSADLFRYMAGWTTKIEGSTVPISAPPAPGEYLAYRCAYGLRFHLEVDAELAAGWPDCPSGFPTSASLRAGVAVFDAFARMALGRSAARTGTSR